MPKGKGTLERKLERNKAHSKDVTIAMERKVKKSTHTRDSAAMSGLGSTEEPDK
jgi:nicotinamide mononucleotide (NMN) deamidase PncC